MPRSVLSRAAVLAAGVAAPLVLLAPAAWAPKYILGASAYGTCAVPGHEGALFQGTFTVTGFSSSGGSLWATGSIVGSCYDGTDVVATVLGTKNAFPVESVTAMCTRTQAHVDIRPGAAEVDGVLGASVKDGEPVTFNLDLAPSTVVERSWDAGDPRETYGRLCAVAANVAHRDPADLATVLNALVLGS